MNDVIRSKLDLTFLPGPITLLQICSRRGIHRMRYGITPDTLVLKRAQWEALKGSDEVLLGLKSRTAAKLRADSHEYVMGMRVEAVE